MRYLADCVESFVQAENLSVRSNSLLPAIIYHVLTVVSSIHAMMVIEIAITSAQMYLEDTGRKLPSRR